MSITDLHGVIANSTIYFFVILASWGYFSFYRKEGISSSYWGSMIIAEILVILQGVLGVYLWVSGGRPGRGGMHILYGICVVIALPGVYAYTKGEDGRRDLLLYSTMSLATVFLLMRAAATGI